MSAPANDEAVPIAAYERVRAERDKTQRDLRNAKRRNRNLLYNLRQATTGRDELRERIESLEADAELDAEGHRRVCAPMAARLEAAEAGPYCWNTGLLNSLCGCKRHQAETQAGDDS